MLASVRDYMQTDGLDAYKKSGCLDGWATLHLVPTLFNAKTFTKKDVLDLIHEALDMFGECEKSGVYKTLKSHFPEAFEKPS